jgi:hypothetical protein
MVALIVVLIVLVVLAIAAAVAYRVVAQRRRGELQAGFGPEYDRTVAGTGSRRDAERELLARQEEHEQLHLRPITEAARARYQEQWAAIQMRFVDTPPLALSEADSLVTRLLADRGYPTDGFDEQARLLSVEHAHVLDDYRRAHAVERANQAGTADTEAVRTAMIDYRRVFEDVMGDTATDSTGTDTMTGDAAAGPVDAYPADVETSGRRTTRTRRPTG